MNKCLFLDRDGVINVDKGYVINIEDFEFIEGIFELTKIAMKENFIICIITNQAGIGRGYFSEEDFLNLSKWIIEAFSQKGITISKIFYSPYHPIYGKGKYKKDHFSRKPNPGMLLDAIKEFNIDPVNSVLIGDKLSDIQAGISADIKTNILLSMHDSFHREANMSFITVKSLNEASSIISKISK